MDKVTLDFCVEKTNELITAPTCSKEAKAAAQSWLKALGTDLQNDETKKYIAELEADIMPIDNLIGFPNLKREKLILAQKPRLISLRTPRRLKKQAQNTATAPLV